eukprot:CAMPEP_0118890226 /NCGR_PEP_ID=MMETSP1166-20130328/789_1 /TAXON_ID=1104430 /ORGANISM="Chrysoreinhardia sp, Strain CCMP3193" /LENGTH=448 /DNA_ID=CAMNT_0006828831 /DNA_START=23 /DNA_END=1369 /DNA_ORIENTATION=+
MTTTSSSSSFFLGHGVADGGEEEGRDRDEEAAFVGGLQEVGAIVEGPFQVVEFRGGAVEVVPLTPHCGPRERRRETQIVVTGEDVDEGVVGGKGLVFVGFSIHVRAVRVSIEDDGPSVGVSGEARGEAPPGEGGDRLVGDVDFAAGASKGLAALASEVADAAGVEILKFWRKPELRIEDKFEAERAMASSPVTEADRAAEAAMRRLIAERYPEHGIRGEEFGESANFQAAEYQWVLDPIDGTKSFMTGKPVFGTLVALCRNGEPVLGVVDQCVLKERWIGFDGVTTLNGEPVKAASNGITQLRDALAYATTPDMFAKGEEADKFHHVKSQVKRMLYGCDCYAYALLASGHVSLVVEADLQPYDFLALVPVVRGAGASIADWDGNALTLHSTTGRVVAAATPQLFQQALGILGKKNESNSSSEKYVHTSSSSHSNNKAAALAFAAGALV